MKKIILSAFMLIGLTFAAHAQDISENALGLRLGSNDGFGGEVSYQRGMSNNNRLELDLGWRNSKDFDAFKLACETKLFDANAMHNFEAKKNKTEQVCFYVKLLRS